MNTFRSKALEAGYAEDEVDALIEKDFQEKARASGYSNKDIESYYESQKTPPETNTQKRKTLGDYANIGIQETAHKAIQPLAGMAEFIPQVFIPELIAQGAQALSNTATGKAGVNRENAVMGMEHLLDKKYNQGWTEDDESNYEQFRQIAMKGPEEFENEPDVDVAQFTPIGLANKLPGVAAETPTDEFLRLTGGLKETIKTTATNLGKTTGKWMSKVFNLPPVVREEIEAFASNAPLAYSAVAAHELFGIPEIFTLGAASGTKLAWENLMRPAGSHVGRKYFAFDPANLNPYEIAVGHTESWKNEVANGRKNAQEELKKGVISPEQYDSVKPYFDLAEKYNVPLTYGSITDSIYYKRIEQMILDDNLTQSEAQSVRQAAAKGWGESLDTALIDMKQNIRYQSTGGVAEALMDNVTRKNYEVLSKTSSRLYNEAGEVLAKSKPIPVEDVKLIEDSLNRVYEKTGSPLIPTPAETAVKEAASEGRSRLTQTPSQAGRPELSEVQLPTGQGAQQAENLAAKQKYNEAVNDYSQKVKALEKAEKKKSSLRRKKGKREAKRQEETAYDEALKAKQFAQHEVERTKKALEKSGETRKFSEAEEKQVLTDLVGKETAENFRFTPEGKIQFIRQDINGKTLTDSIRSLNSKLDWENPNIVNLFQDTRKTFQDILEKNYSKEHPEALKKHRIANKMHAQRERLFGDNALWNKWGLKKDVLPEDLLKTLTTVERVKRFEKDFPQSKQLMSYFKRLKVEEELKPIFQKANYDPGQIAGDLASLESNEMFQYMLPKQTKQNLKELQKLDLHLQRTASRFFSNAQPTLPAVNILTDIGYALNLPLMATKIGARIGKENLARVYAEILSNPNFTSEMKKIGEEASTAAKNGNFAKLREVQTKSKALQEQLINMGQLLVAGEAQELQD